MEEWLIALSQTGFPIAVSIFLLTRYQTSIDKNTEKLIEISSTQKMIAELLKK